MQTDSPRSTNDLDGILGLEGYKFLKLNEHYFRYRNNNCDHNGNSR